MLNFILILLCVASGFIIRTRGFLPRDAYKSINTWILNIALPAAFLRYIPGIKWQGSLVLPILSPLIVWAGAWAFVSLFSTLNKTDPKSKGAMMLTAGLSNTAFLGYISVYFGEKEIGIAVLYDQVTFILLSTAGIITAVLAAKKEKLTWRILSKKMLKFPPFIICIIALILPVDFSAANPLFDKIAATIGPMALFSIGLQMSFTLWKSAIKPLLACITYKLFIAPVLVFLFALVIGQKGSLLQLSVFESAMPTLATAAVLADEYGLDPGLSNLVVCVGILMSFITMTCWWLLLRNF